MNPEHKTIITKLIDKTKAKQAIWNKTSRDDEFMLKLGPGSITVDLWRASNNADYADMRIWNNKGVVIDSVNAPIGSADFTDIKNLHDAAKRSFYKVEETLQSFISELDSKKIAGIEEPDEDDLPF